jgi:RimJ/RimL family protein N-acetyltransferase
MRTMRPATFDDAATLFAWRNDTVTRAMSSNTDPVPWETHLEWLAATLADEGRTLFICEEDGVPVGTVRIDASGKMSWTVAPEARGRGLASIMIAMAGPQGCTATIKAENVASQRAARKAGFRLVSKGPMQEWRCEHQPASISPRSIARRRSISSNAA